jgi:prepilin peptidase CpaA
MGVAGVLDLRDRRIPNWLTLGGLLLALTLRLAAGFSPFLDGLGGAGLGLVLGVLCFAIGALGGGDGKLLIAAGAFLGIDGFVGASLAIGILGGLLGVMVAVRRGVILPAVLEAGGMLKRWVRFRRAAAPKTVESPGAVTVPYGVAIATGALVWWFWGVPVL